MTYVREPTYEVSFLFRKVLVPVDGSAASMKALDVALDFAKRYGSRVTVMIANDGSVGDVNSVVEDVEAKARGAGVRVKVIVTDVEVGLESAASKILETIEEGDYDLVVLSARGRSANPEVNIGSVALSVIVNTATSVMLIR